MANISTGLQRNMQINSSGGEFALALKVFTGEIFAQYSKPTYMSGLYMSKAAMQGNAHQFLYYGNVGAGYHLPGKDILDESNGLLFKQPWNERVVFIDHPLTSNVFTPEFDTNIAHVSDRAPLATKMAEALRDTADAHRIRTLIKAARAGASVSGDFGGSSALGANSVTDLSGSSAPTAINSDTLIYTISVNVDAWALSLRRSSEILDDKLVPKTGRVAFIPNVVYNAFVEDGRYINRDFSTANGDRGQGVILSCWDFNLVKMHKGALPSTDESAAITGVRNGPNNDGTGYSADFRRTLAVCFAPDATVTLQRGGLKVEAEWQPRYKGWALYASTLMGHGIINPKHVVEITKVTP